MVHEDAKSERDYVHVGDVVTLHLFASNLFTAVRKMGSFSLKSSRRPRGDTFSENEKVSHVVHIRPTTFLFFAHMCEDKTINK